jgi:uncharacterized membrane protein
VRNLRFWVLVLVFTSFAIGLASGAGVAMLVQKPAPDAGPFADYERRLVERFQLPPERARLLRVVLASYNQEIEEIKDRHMADYTSAMEPELMKTGRQYRDLILNRVIPHSQRSELEQIALGVIPTDPRH